jgi:putative transposase
MKRTVSTTVRIKLHSLTNRKADLLAREYEAFQAEVHGGDADLYSATKQQASKVQRQKDPNPGTEQPVVLRNDVFDVSHDEDTVLSSWWVRVPVYDPERGRGSSIWCPAHVPHKDEQLVREGDIRDSELVRRNGDWYVHLVVNRSVTVTDEYDDVLAIDMGARWVATCAFLSDRKTTFYGEEVRRTREHYKQLRKSIGKAKPQGGQQVVGRVGDAEARKVDDRLHKISRRIVEDAERRNAVIVVGDLAGIHEDNDKGRYVNDKTHKMPFARLLNYIEYKAHDEGIDVQLVDEYDTSQTCNRCASEGIRETQGRFECPECGLDDNADKNGALNIGKRALGKFSKPLSEAGAVLARPETQVIVHRDAEPVNLSLSVDSTPSGGTPRP